MMGRHCSTRRELNPQRLQLYQTLPQSFFLLLSFFVFLGLSNAIEYPSSDLGKSLEALRSEDRFSTHHCPKFEKLLLLWQLVVWRSRRTRRQSTFLPAQPRLSLQEFEDQLLRPLTRVWLPKHGRSQSRYLTSTRCGCSRAHRRLARLLSCDC